MYCRIRILVFQLLHKRQQGAFLFWSSRVLGSLTICRTTANVADSDGVCVVMKAVCAFLLQFAAKMYASIAVYDVVIADVLPPVAFHMPAAYVFDGEVFAFSSRAAMDYDFFYSTHINQNCNYQDNVFQLSGVGPLH